MAGVLRLAAIDIGTVTTRLLVADVSASGIAEVRRCTDITHLGEGLTATGRLSDAAMQRVATVIASYAQIIAELGVGSVTALATSASRDAENGDDFLALLAEHGIVPEIIPGEREARLSFAGAASDMEPCENLLVVDLGGGSTELILGDVRDEGGVRSAEIVKARSVDVGSKRVTERFLHSDPPTPAELAEAREWATTQLRPYFDGLRDRPQLMVAVAGTATSLSSIRQELEVYDSALIHCSCLTGPELADLTEMLASMTLERRKNLPGLDPGRAPVIVAGALILETILALAGLDSTLVSEHDILYGILLDSFRELRSPAASPAETDSAESRSAG
jgi:exopolyphosphatase/guanosine-5'-triphosphate,3'-diphosphate pyrophosphatase